MILIYNKTNENHYQYKVHKIRNNFENVKGIIDETKCYNELEHKSYCRSWNTGGHMESFCSTKSIFSGISKEYMDNKTFQQRYFTYDHTDTNAWIERADKVQGKNYNRQALVDALKHINIKLGAGEKTLNNIEKLKSDKALCIVTGQQTGVLGGPLYTLYKAATTIKRARTLSEELGTDVLPVFWLASEDHDFEEVREAKYIDDGKLRKSKVDKKPGPGNNNPFKNMHNHSYLKEPLGWVDINTSVKSLMIEVSHALEDMAYKAWCQSIFEQTLQDEETLSDWFARIYLKIFEKEGLIVVDPMNKDIRGLGKDFIKKALSGSQKIVNSVIERASELEQEGFKPLIEPRQGATGLYYLERGERIPLIYEEGMYTVQEGDDREAFCKDELLKLMDKHPGDFSTNVILRPVIQDVYLPTLAYVAGPGEASYYAQLKEVYEYFDMEMPIILPRENFTVCQKNIKVNLESLGLDVDQVLAMSQQATEKKILLEKDTLDVDNLFEEFSKQFDTMYQELIKQLEKIDDDILAISDKNQALIHQQFDYLKQKSYRFHRRNHKDTLSDIKRIYNWIKPEGGLQERTLSLLSVLGIGGPGFIDQITNQMEYTSDHRIIIVD